MRNSVDRLACRDHLETGADLRKGPADLKFAAAEVQRWKKMAVWDDLQPVACAAHTHDLFRALVVRRQIIVAEGPIFAHSPQASRPEVARAKTPRVTRPQQRLAAHRRENDVRGVGPKARVAEQSRVAVKLPSVFATETAVGKLKRQGVTSEVLGGVLPFADFQHAYLGPVLTQFFGRDSSPGA